MTFQIEREYMARIAREQAGDVPESSAQTTAPRVVDRLAVPPGE